MRATDVIVGEEYVYKENRWEAGRRVKVLAVEKHDRHQRGYYSWDHGRTVNSVMVHVRHLDDDGNAEPDTFKLHPDVFYTYKGGEQWYQARNLHGLWSVLVEDQARKIAAVKAENARRKVIDDEAAEHGVTFTWLGPVGVGLTYDEFKNLLGRLA